MDMKFNETKKVGLDIFFINVILLLFIYSQDGLSVMNLILAALSSLIALGLNIYYLYRGSKTKINKIFLVLNAIVFLTVIIYMIIRFI